MKAKKIIAMLLATVMTFSLAACGGTKTDATGNDNETTETTPAADSGNDDADDADTSDAGTADADYEELLAEIIPEETVTLDVYDQLANYSGEQIGWFAQVMLEKFNVKLNIIPNAEGVFATRMEAGDLGDIVIWGDDSNDYLQAVEKGMLYDWEEDDLLAEFSKRTFQKIEQENKSCAS